MPAVLINDILILQVHVANAPHKTTVVCSRSSIAEDDTTDVQGPGPNVCGVLLLQIMMQINCLAIVEEEVK